MPRSFTGNVDTVNPVKIPGTSLGPSNPLEGMDKIAEVADNALTGHVLKGLQRDLTSDGSEGDAFLYDKSRELKDKMIKAGAEGNQQAVDRYVAELEKLKIAEKQGLMGPAAVETRRATIAKDYITRFPHLAADIKKVYSASGGSGGGGGGSEKEQFIDPIEQGQNDLLKEWAPFKDIVPLGDFVRAKEAKRKKEALLQDYEVRAKMGLVAENSYAQHAQNTIEEATNKVQVTRYSAIAQAEKTGKFDAAIVKNLMAAERDQNINELRRDFQTMTANSNFEQGAIVNPQTLDRHITDLRKVWDDAIADVQDLDQLKTMTRLNQYAAQKGIANLKNLSAFASVATTLSPEKGIDYLTNDLKKAFDLNRAGFLDQFSATTGSMVSRAAIEEIRNMDPKMAYGAFLNAVMTGDFGEFGIVSPQAAAVAVNSIASTALANPNLPPEVKNPVAIATYERQKQDTGRTIPVADWFKDVNKRAQLKDNPELANRIQQDVSTEAVNIVPELSDLGLVGKLQFNPNPQVTGDKPWLAYKDGGPVSFTSGPVASVSGVTGMSGVGGAIGNTSLSKAQVKAQERLNTGYWIVYYSDSPAAAATWVRDIQDSLEKKAKADAPPSAPQGPMDYTGLSPEEKAWIDGVAN